MSNENCNCKDCEHYCHCANDSVCPVTDCNCKDCEH